MESNQKELTNNLAEGQEVTENIKPENQEKDINPSQEIKKEEQQQEVKTFTQEDVNRIATKESKQALEKMLKDLGVENFKTAKEGLEKYKEYLDSQKSEQEKLIERAENESKRVLELEVQLKEMNLKNACLKADVRPEALEEVVLLANAKINDEVNDEEAINQILTKFPQFKKENNVDVLEEKEDKNDTPPPMYTPTGNNKNVETDINKDLIMRNLR